MTQLSQLYTHSFVQTVTTDEHKAFKDIEFDATAIELPEDVVLDEYQYYIHNTGFYLVHTLAWCRQLDLAVEFLSNFDYSKRVTANRADHLIFNIENYLIRLNSVYDRVLQIVNAVFHLCIDEENVAHSVVITNYKVTHRPEIRSKIKAVKKFLDDYTQTRHTLIHKHSYLDVELRGIERMYMVDLDNLKEVGGRPKGRKSSRARFLRDFIQKKKDEFATINSGLSERMDALLSALQDEYGRQKAKLAGRP